MLRSAIVAITLTTAAALAACTAPRTETEVESAAWGYTGVGSNMYLSAHGLGSREESLAYYGATLSGTSSSSYTLEKWKAQFIGGASVVTSLYRNQTELGFWREMTCSEHIARGVGGCTVTNWDSPGDTASVPPKANRGTVAMNVSPEGFVRFYVFLPDGRLSPSAVLDEEGPKFMPRLCTVCHSGADPTPGKSPDLGSVFREFEPHLLEARPDVARVTAEQEWFRLNRVVQQANAAIRSESDGSPRGTDHARKAINERIDALYIPGGEPDALPPSWEKADDASKALWNKLIVPYCIACHRHNDADWTRYERFEGFRGPFLRQYLPDAPDPTMKVPAMPQAAVSFALLKSDEAARTALAVWLGEKKPDTSYRIGGKPANDEGLTSVFIDDDVSIQVNDREVFSSAGSGSQSRPPFRIDAVPGDVVTMRFYDTFGRGRRHDELWLAGPGTPPQRVALALTPPRADYPAQTQPFSIETFRIPKPGEQASVECLPEEKLQTSLWPRVPALTVLEATTKRYRARWAHVSSEYDFQPTCDGWVSDHFIASNGAHGWVGWNTITDQIRVSPINGHPYDAAIGRAAAEYAKKTLFPAADMATLQIITD